MLDNPLKNIDVAQALREDVGEGDLTASLIPPAHHSRAQVLTREDAVLCGTHWFNAVFRRLDTRVEIQWQAQDGDEVRAKQEICALAGPTRALLTGERTALNFLQMLSGTATVTRAYARTLQGTQSKLLDTRKTIPGLREAQKYAVRCGGGYNHRLGLFDGVLIKENHIAALGSIAAAVVSAKARYPKIPIEVEIENPAQIEEAIGAGADLVLLDNFTVDQLHAAVARNRGRVRLEASGGFDLDTLRAVAETGVDFISVGALTKHVRAIDFSMRFVHDH
ncbi:MAG: carboxylating nicotinate-nucleotide diphosphorylase [Gammaproteobacteria bacterium]